MLNLPQHLQKYIVEQNYEKYTALDHAVWRYILRQLKNFLGKNAHEAYLDGLKKTGIDIEQIPRISDISACLEKFGWRALPVSGFIPPAAFMELQSLGVLPIASDMRSLDHLLYTPAPDIVHEAAGHAPIIADPEYAEYLRQYAQVARKALISNEDLELYKAIRELSDIKENPASTSAQINKAEEALSKISNSISFVSEASQLSRMNWWTAEYGLIGSAEAPKIFGAGLLSSVGESKWCLSSKVKKIPLSIACVDQSYDITEPQPQLFVAKDFRHLAEVLEDFSQSMSYKLGGLTGLQRALACKTVNTIEFENGLQISGQLTRIDHAHDKAFYLQFQGPCQICYHNQEVKGHGRSHHSQGYGTPVELPLEKIDYLSQLNKSLQLNFSSGVQINGTLTRVLNLGDFAQILSFKNAEVRNGEIILFRPEWGVYDMLLVENVTSVFGGPADRVNFGETEDFVAARVSPPKYTENQKQLFSLYQRVRNLREASNFEETSLTAIYQDVCRLAPNEWLLYVELFEICPANTALEKNLRAQLTELSSKHPDKAELISEGLRLAGIKN